MRLTLVVYSLAAGGAERVLTTMANYWAERGRPVTVLTLVDDREPPFYDLHPAVRLRPLGLADTASHPVGRAWRIVRRLWKLRVALAESDPDVILSFMDRTNVLVLLASRRLGVPVIASEHIDPFRNGLGPLWRLVQRGVYRRAACVVVLTRGALSYFPPAVRRRARVIPNPVVAPPARRMNRPTTAEPVARTVIAIGRLDRQKGFDLLLEAFAVVAPRHDEWSLVVWGEGHERAALESLRDDLELRHKVSFPGLTKQPFARLAAADLFVLSSRYEGFPMVLCEAMARGLPTISFACPSGPREIVRDGIDGVLVEPENVAALATALDRLMGDEAERRRLADRAPRVLDRFGLERVMGMWEELIAPLASEPRRRAGTRDVPRDIARVQTR